MKARIIKIISNQYSVQLEDSTILEAYPTGKMRLKQRLCVGDFVLLDNSEGKYGIVDVLERKNVLKRPFLANVDQAYILMSFKDPNFSFELVNRLVILIEYADVLHIIFITKADLGYNKALKDIKEYYNQIGLDVYFSYKDVIDETLLASFKHKVSVLCGQSGVGKTSIINKFDPSLNLKTDITSKALGRGKHTTRHVELYELNEGLVADTPGFSSIDLRDIDINLLKDKISIFNKYSTCYYRDCMHINEPDCGVKKAILDNLIPKTFYDSYVEIVNMIKMGNYSFNTHRRLK